MSKQPNIRKTNQSNQGFTLIEVLVATAITVILGAGFLGMQYIFSSNQVSAWKSYYNVDEANRVASQLTKELRNIQESEDGSFPISTALDQEIIFYSDVNQDGDVDRVRYTLAGTTLTKGVTAPTDTPLSYDPLNEKVQTLTDNIRNGIAPLFYYYNNAWPFDTINNPLSSTNRIADTKHIKVYLRTNIKIDDADNDFIIESEANLRSLRKS